jgi:hypothetical protein
MVIWTTELYPTTVRSAGMGIVFGIGLSGGALSPYVVELAEKMEINPLILIGVIGITGTISAFFLTETKDKPLLNEIKELDLSS